MVKKTNYKVGSKNSCRRWISKKLDKAIKEKMLELKISSNNPNNVTYLYASKVLGGRK